MKIAVIDNYDSFVFNLVRYLEDIDNTEIVIFRNNKVDFDTLTTCDSIVLSPGPGIPSEAGQLMEVIEQFHRTKPILGVCLGHQALGEFFGAELVQNEHPLHGKSTSIQQLNDSSFFKSLSQTFEVGRYHSWSIKLQKDIPLQVIAETQEGEVMAIKHTTLPIYGVQFHPESILTPHGRTMINNWVQSVNTEQITLN